MLYNFLGYMLSASRGRVMFPKQQVRVAELLGMDNVPELVYE